MVDVRVFQGGQAFFPLSGLIPRRAKKDWRQRSRFMTWALQQWGHPRASKEDHMSAKSITGWVILKFF